MKKKIISMKSKNFMENLILDFMDKRDDEISKNMMIRYIKVLNIINMQKNEEKKIKKSYKKMSWKKLF